MNKDEIVEQRMSICRSCEHYNNKTNCCTRVAVRTDPTRLGKLDHPNGVFNLRSRCPIRKWDFIPSRHVHEIEKLIGTELTYETQLALTRNGLNQNTKLDWLWLIVKYYQNNNLTPPKNSEILSELTNIIKMGNNY